MARDSYPNVTTKTALSCLLLILAANSVRATTLISVTVPDSDLSPLTVLNEAYAASWTLSQPYSNVSILVAVGSFGGLELETAYLTNSIGPGTSQANNEVASTSFIFPDVNAPTWITIFSGLNLGPGTYYLMLDEAGLGGGNGVWFGNLGGANSVTLGPGVLQGPEYLLFPRVVQGPSIYPPSTQFLTPFHLGLEYSVIAIPEPASSFVTALGLGALGVLAWANYRRRWLWHLGTHRNRIEPRIIATGAHSQL